MIAYLKLLNIYCGISNIRNSLFMHFHVSAGVAPEPKLRRPRRTWMALGMADEFSQTRYEK